MLVRSLRLTGAAAACAFLLVTAGHAADREIALTIEGNRFNPDEVKVAAGAAFVLVITNKDKAPEEFESGPLRIEKVIPAGKTVRIKVRALKAGAYPFVGDFHERTARGRIVAE